MTTSADVASHAGLSRSTVSQILNGREHLFSADTIARVRASAAELGYRPSLAGRTLARGTSDIVITLLSNVTFNPRLRELVDTITADLAAAGLTNLLRFMGEDNTLEDALLGLKPYGVVSLAWLSEEQRERLQQRGVRLIDQPQDVQVRIDRAIGELQAQHLAAAGYQTICFAAPVADRERSFATPRESGAQAWATRHGIHLAPTLHVPMERGSGQQAISRLDEFPIGIAAYNDEIAMALLGAAIHAGLRVPDDVGIVGVDNSPIAQASTPSITTVDYDIQYSAHTIVSMLLQGSDTPPPKDPAGQVAQRLRVVQGASTRTPPTGG